MSITAGTVGAVVKATWPFIVVLATGLIGWGTLRADVAQLKHEQAEQTTDHDVLTRVDERQKTMAEDMKTMKEDIKEIAKAVK